MRRKDRQNREHDRRANRTVLWRTIFLMVFFGVVLFFPLLGKLWEIQIVKYDYYKELATKQQTSDLTVPADRGTIYDARGNALSISATVQTVVLSPRDILEAQEAYAKAVEDAGAGKGQFPDYPEPASQVIAAKLAGILDLEESSILETLARTSRQYEVVKSKVEEDVAEQVEELVSEYHLGSGLYLVPDTKRYYPNSSLASHVIGFVNSDNEGAYGLEAKYNDLLTGEAGRVVTAKNAKGTEMLSHYENYISAKDGADLNLTIHNSIQSMLESCLAEGIEKYDVQYGGFAIAMDPNTGAILGMASSPEYDLNNPSVITDSETAQALAELKLTDAETAELETLRAKAAEEEDGSGLSDAERQELERLEEKDESYQEARTTALFEQWRSKAINETYEPGSTFKCMVLAAALEEGVVNENDSFTCTGSVHVADYDIRCSNRTGHGTQDLATAVANSCNPAFIAIGQRLGAEKFYDYLERFGMIGKTGIDVPGEASNENLVWTRELFESSEGISSLATASFGQRFQITPIQLITGVAATINGGHLLEPYVVESAVDSDGYVVYQHETTEVRQVISEQTSERVRTILEGVVDGGTGKNAYMAGYRIGGKTGTSQTISEDDHNIVSFVGFAPANDPQVVVLLAFDGPKPTVPGGTLTADQVYISGGQMAAPMAGKLIANICDYLGVAKQYTTDELSGADVLVPKVTGQELSGAVQALEQSGLSYRTVGEGTMVTGQIPAAGAAIPGNSQVVLYLDDESVPDEQVEVPNVMNLPLSEVQQALSSRGLYLRATGATDYYSSAQKAIDQSIEAGALVDPGTVIEVQFIDGSVHDWGGSEISKSN